MAIPDMDICLNVTTGSAVPKRKDKQRNVDSFETSIKRLKNQAFQKGIVVNTQETGHKKRIKQKSLSTIVAKKLKQANISNKQQQFEILSQGNAAKAESKSIKKSGATKEDLRSNKASSSAITSDTNKPIISFAKPTEANFGKTLLAKRRNTTGGEQKKSLSDIFSNQSKDRNELNVVITQKHDINSETEEESVIGTKKSSVSKQAKGIGILSKKKEKKRKEKTTDNDRESDKMPKLMHRGKTSSLFGNNPDVPTIGQRLVKPVHESVFTEITFADLDIHPFTISNLEKNMHITNMTTVQQKAIPQIFSARDVLIRSQTGSGKTLAYALPIVELLHKIRPKLSRNSGLSALIVVPTRELALQTYECFIKLIRPFTWIVPGYIVGGEKRKAEKARLRRGCNILIATPGRLLDHIKQTKALRLNEVKYFVLDEADRMLDMGYEKDISGIVSALKVSGSNNNTGYDAMKIFKQNAKKSGADDETEEMSKQDSVESSNKIKRSNIHEEEQEYHSNDDSDDDNNHEIVPLKKKKKIPTKHSDAKEKVTVDSTQNAEQDCENANQPRRQTILLSATLTQAVEKLAGLTMHNPIFVDAAKENLEVTGGDASEINEDLIVPQSVVQSYIVTPPKLRMVTLSAYIAGRCQIPGQHKILIFMATQDMVDYHTDILSSILTKPMNDDDEDSDPLVDVEFFKLHGNMKHAERKEIFKTFRQTKSGVLLCTDVAARGLDMPKVDCVVQYTGPISARDYVHRIGRTARAGCSGTATIFLTPPEIEFVRMLESRRIRIKQQDMNDVLDKLLGPFSRHNSVQAAATALQNDFENLVLESKQLGEKACRAYLSWMRFYSSYPRDMREIFNRRELHLGHYAKSFALRTPPQQIGMIGKKLRDKESSKPKHNNRLTNESSDGVPRAEERRSRADERRTGLLKRVRMLNTSEYDSGLEPPKKPKK